MDTPTQSPSPEQQISGTDILNAEQSHFDPIFRPLFRAAQSKQEFEYACTLLRLRGMESAGWDAFRESRQLVLDIVSLSNTPLLREPKLRLGLLMYLHITEMDAPYHIVYNLLRVINGERYSISPFRDPSNGQTEKYPSGKIAKIVDLANRLNFPSVGDYFESFVSRQIRNAFAHSQYTIHGNNFNITEGEGVEVGGVITRSVPVGTYLAPRIDRAINFAFLFVDLLSESIAEYTESKIVKGDMQGPGSNIDIELTVEPEYGLTGFRTPPSSELLKSRAEQTSGQTPTSSAPTPTPAFPSTTQPL